MLGPGESHTGIQSENPEGNFSPEGAHHNMHPTHPPTQKFPALLQQQRYCNTRTSPMKHSLSPLLYRGPPEFHNTYKLHHSTACMMPPKTHMTHSIKSHLKAQHNGSQCDYFQSLKTFQKNLKCCLIPRPSPFAPAPSFLSEIFLEDSVWLPSP